MSLADIRLSGNADTGRAGVTLLAIAAGVTGADLAVEARATESHGASEGGVAGVVFLHLPKEIAVIGAEAIDAFACFAPVIVDKSGFDVGDKLLEREVHGRLAAGDVGKPTTGGLALAKFVGELAAQILNGDVAASTVTGKEGAGKREQQGQD